MSYPHLIKLAGSKIGSLLFTLGSLPGCNLYKSSCSMGLGIGSHLAPCILFSLNSLLNKNVSWYLARKLIAPSIIVSPITVTLSRGQYASYCVDSHKPLLTVLAKSMTLVSGLWTLTSACSSTLTNASKSSSASSYTCSGYRPLGSFAYSSGVKLA